MSRDDEPTQPAGRRSLSLMWCPATENHKCPRPRECIGATCRLVELGSTYGLQPRRTSTLFEVRGRTRALVLVAAVVLGVLAYRLAAPLLGVH